MSRRDEKSVPRKDLSGRRPGPTMRAMEPGSFVRFVSIPALIVMKEVAGRPRDVDDIQHLSWILEEKSKR